MIEPRECVCEQLIRQHWPKQEQKRTTSEEQQLKAPLMNRVLPALGGHQLRQEYRNEAEGE